MDKSQEENLRRQVEKVLGISLKGKSLDDIPWDDIPPERIPAQGWIGTPECAIVIPDSILRAKGKMAEVAEAVKKDPKGQTFYLGDESEISPEEIRKLKEQRRSQSILSKSGVFLDDYNVLHRTAMNLIPLLSEQMAQHSLIANPKLSQKLLNSGVDVVLNELDIVVHLLYKELGDDANLVDQLTLHDLPLMNAHERALEIKELRKSFELMRSQSKPAAAPDRVSQAIKEITDKAEIQIAVQKALLKNAGEAAILKTEFLEYVRKEKPEFEDEIMEEYERQVNKSTQRGFGKKGE